MDHLPPKEKLCHHTGFEKQCRALVCEGACSRWVHHPGQGPFKHIPKASDWGCIDDMLLFVAGEAAQQADAGHSAVTNFREMVIKRALGPADEPKQIEGD